MHDALESDGPLCELAQIGILGGIRGIRSAGTLYLVLVSRE